MSSFKSLASSLLGTAVLLTVVAAPVFAAPATPATSTKPAVQAPKPQANGVVFTPKTITVDTKEFQGKVSIPVISGMKDKAFEAKLNATLLKEAQTGLAEGQKAGKEDAEEAKKNGWEPRPHALDISYEVYNAGNLVSFSVQTYIYTGGAHGMTDVSYYNIDNQPKSKQLKLAELFQSGHDYRTIFNQIILQQIKEETEEDGFNPYDGFESIREDQGFFFKDGNLMIHFGQYEIAAYAAGMPEFTIPAQRYQDLLKSEIREALFKK
ncbi:DUF3298 and DUF4163 domain-containing protein [Brevibacillus sp. AG]|uniref:DUF3298 and DUF4163 domain-containing protein n=1 Tax=Brevibacillus sp. AG TaxID=3020891 RepID=UPI000852CFE2|nr:DUF3298 and DUF4163 domain-containing protein [Brevibacillus sp. AG]MDC0761577.1 DUF3298 and DUF4163 domain-containing protein [Brevibacillus sp. AG]